jgi:hypothetical protein
MDLPRQMMRSTARVIGCLAAVTLIPVALYAQSPRPITLDATVGHSGGLGGGEFKDRQGIALDGLLAYAVRRAPGGALLTAVNASQQGALGDDAVCVPGSRGQCLHDFPGISTVGLMAGWEGRTGTGRAAGATARVLAGPAYVHLDGDDAAGQPGSTAGLQARLDLASPQLGPVALVGSLRGTTVPRFRGERYGVWALGFGVRVR